MTSLELAGCAITRPVRTGTTLPVRGKKQPAAAVAGRERLLADKHDDFAEASFAPEENGFAGERDLPHRVCSRKDRAPGYGARLPAPVDREPGAYPSPDPLGWLGALIGLD